MYKVTVSNFIVHLKISLTDNAFGTNFTTSDFPPNSDSSIIGGALLIFFDVTMKLLVYNELC